MRNIVIAGVLLLGLSAVSADRPRSKAVLEALNTLRPRYKDIQDFVINTIGDARLNSSVKLGAFHEDILTVKETFVLDAIQKEDALLFQINNQPPSVEKLCLSFVQSLVDSVMNLAGTSFTNCIIDTSDNLKNVTDKFYATLLQDETDYIGVGLLNVFKDENIFYYPEAILSKLQTKTSLIENYPTYLASYLYRTVDSFGKTLKDLEISYIGCMTEAEHRLRGSFAMSDDYMRTTCGAVAVPVPPGPPGNVGSAPSENPEERQAEPEALRIFREQFGLNLP